MIRKIRINSVFMYTDTRAFIAALGGYRSVATRLGKKPTTVHSHMQRGALPASWYDALCHLAHEMGLHAPDRGLFSFLQIEEEAV